MVKEIGMDDHPDVLNYTKSACAGRRIPSQSVINRLWLAYWILAAAMLFLCLAIELENFHFDSFFPRRASGPGSHRLKSFTPDIVVDEFSWRDWQGMLTENIDCYTKPLSADDRANLAIRVAENDRWNRFVVLVKWGSPFLIASSAIVLVLSLLLLRWLDWRAVIWRWRLTHALLIASILMILDVFVRGYLRLFGDRIW